MILKEFARIREWTFSKICIFTGYILPNNWGKLFSWGVPVLISTLFACLPGTCVMCMYPDTAKGLAISPRGKGQHCSLTIWG